MLFEDFITLEAVGKIIRKKENRDEKAQSIQYIFIEYLPWAEHSYRESLNQT